MNKKEVIEFLKKSLEEIPRLARLPYNNQEVILWCNSIEDVLEKFFGRNSTAYRRFHETRTTKTSAKLTKKIQWQNRYIRLMQRRRTEILSIIQQDERLGIEEKSVKKTARKDTTKSPLKLFDSMKFHPKVIEASRGLFRDGHYPDAIYRAFVALNNFVKKKSGLSPNEIRGMKDSQLMAKVFDVNNPIIKLNELLTDTDISEQEGFKFLFMGATIGIRNPKAHENIIQNDPYKALEYLSFASLLMQTIDFWEAEKT